MRSKFFKYNDNVTVPTHTVLHVLFHLTLLVPGILCKGYTNGSLGLVSNLLMLYRPPLSHKHEEVLGCQVEKSLLASVCPSPVPKTKQKKSPIDTLRFIKIAKNQHLVM